MSGAQEFSGTLRERITVERQETARDNLGGAAGDWQLVGTFWAAIASAGTGDEERSEARDAAPRWRVTLRGTDAVLPGDRLSWAGRQMTVRSVSCEPRPFPVTTINAEEKR